MARPLEGSQRTLLELVSRAAFENPFGETRDRLDEQIAETPSTAADVLPRLLSRVSSVLEAIATTGPLSPAGYAAPDAELVEHAILFESFHRYVGALDELIAAQLDAGPRPVPVAFARELLSLLASRGIAAERAERMLTLFYQMRRAYFFVARGLVGRSAAMRRLRESLWSAIFTRDIRLYDRFLWDRMEDFSTILLGETGTGKGAAAAAIGRSGFIPFDVRRGTFAFSFADTFVHCNLSELPESLLEAELFGYKKGAFTGATEDRDGLFDRCRAHAAIFLDEIGEAGPPVQIKLLRVLQEREYFPVGGREKRRFAGRVIAATHRPLHELRRDGRFRADFYYRLSSVQVRVPSLRERLAEEPQELDDLLASLVPRLVGQESPELTSLVRTTIVRDLGDDHPWPGNVRELEQAVRRILLTGNCVPDPDATPTRDGAAELAELMRAGSVTADDLVRRYVALLHEKRGTFVDVAKITGLDRRTVKKYLS